MARIAVDAMGGDRAPDEVVHGAVAAARSGIDVVLVGDDARIAALLSDSDATGEIDIVPASQVIGMAEDPGSAIRDKKDASVTVAARLVATGEAQGMVSAGSTGAAMAAAVFVIGRISGVSRPAIATLLPLGKIILDAGANLSCRPEHLVQFAVMGSALSSSHFGIAEPAVGLLNIGEEEGKGRDLEKEAHRLLGAVPGVRFVGNVEGRDLATDRADVVVTDGFTGNVVLKALEGGVRTVVEALLAAFSTDESTKAHADALMPALMPLYESLDPDTYGGAILLGVDGLCIISHGSSGATAMQNAITMAAEMSAANMVDELRVAISGW